MAVTKIEWTEETWNPIVGCSVHSAGCTNCYAMKMAWRLQAMANAGNEKLAHYQGTVKKVKGNAVWTGKLGFSEDALLAPLRRKKPTRYFVNSMSDLFHKDMPCELIDRIFAVMALCPQHEFQVLTKRSDVMREYFDALPADRISHEIDELAASGLGNPGYYQWPLPNVWLGVSVENQAAADERIPDLLATPAALRWISAEPLLGPVDLRKWIGWVHHHPDNQHSAPLDAISAAAFAELRARQPFLPRIDWIVVGGESGTGARPMHPDWVRSLRNQCAAVGTAFFFKQWGEWFPYGHIDADGHHNSRTRGEKPGLWHDWPNRLPDQDDHFSVLIGKKAAGRFLDGVIHDAMPTPKAQGLRA